MLRVDRNNSLVVNQSDNGCGVERKQGIAVGLTGERRHVLEVDFVAVEVEKVESDRGKTRLTRCLCGYARNNVVRTNRDDLTIGCALERFGGVGVVQLGDDSQVGVGVHGLNREDGGHDCGVARFVGVQNNYRLRVREVDALEVDRVGWVTGAGYHL